MNTGEETPLPTDGWLIPRVARLECENPSDARLRDSLVMEWLHTGQPLRESASKWLLILLNRGGTRFIPPAD